jgi:hypothetical protein
MVQQADVHVVPWYKQLHEIKLWSKIHFKRSMSRKHVLNLQLSDLINKAGLTNPRLLLQHFL